MRPQTLQMRPSLGTAVHARHGNFVARRRSGRQAMRPGPLALVLRRQVRGGPHRVNTFIAAVWWRLATSVRLHRAAAASRTVTLRPRAGLSPKRLSPFASRTPRALLRRTHTIEREIKHASVLVQVRRSRGTGAPGERMAAVPPPAMIVTRRSPAAAPAAGPAAPAAPRSAAPEVGWSPKLTTVTAPDLALPPRELSRVTEHVIGELDRRVLSWRERTGQV